MRFMSKRQYTKSPDLRQAKVGIGGCSGEAQRGIVIKKRWVRATALPKAAPRALPERGGRKTGRDARNFGKRKAYCLLPSFCVPHGVFPAPSRLTHFVRRGAADAPDLPRPTLSFLRSAFGSFPYPSVSRSHFLLCFILRQDAGVLGRCRSFIYKSKRKPANCSNNVLDIR